MICYCLDVLGILILFSICRNDVKKVENWKIIIKYRFSLVNEWYIGIDLV